ncbi:MAG: trehalase family glycosidase [Limnochordia bacterium]|nr:hypothetical protein [Limnochordia bacterium]MDD2630385.1 trehalase family glycosidase [Limnochordia bacterium]MDD4518704.1 trehalase family glycosidase [Limnochordia bacterium]
MNRLGYADPNLAQRAILSPLRDTPSDNVPCVFASGGFNMVAEDGSICGTSPAWCLPFYNIYLLYLRTRDKDWLRQLYPYLSAYVKWWLEERVDEDGWLVYKCTWESGEDNNPRIDPERKGNTIVSGVIRPVELQAAMAHSCYIMEYFAEEIGKPLDQGNWRKVRRQYTEYVQLLWDENAGRFRDYDKRTRDFLESPGTEDYWGGDAIRFSALNLIPALFDTATPHQRERLREEIALYNRKPYIEWPSWTFVLLETAVACGMYDFAAEVAAQICERVYNENDRTLD